MRKRENNKVDGCSSGKTMINARISKYFGLSHQAKCKTLCNLVFDKTGEPIPLSKNEKYLYLYNFGIENGVNFDKDSKQESVVVIKTTTKIFIPHDEWLKQSKAFYRSSAWLKLRYKVIQKYGAKCMICGRRPPEVTIHVDHIKPRSKYPALELDFDNMQILCEECNFGKSNIDETDWRLEFKD